MKVYPETDVVLGPDGLFQVFLFILRLKTSMAGTGYKWVFLCGTAANNDSHELYEGQSIPEDYDAAIKSSENVSDEGVANMLLLLIDCLISTFVLMSSSST